MSTIQNPNSSHHTTEITVAVSKGGEASLIKCEEQLEHLFF